MKKILFVLSLVLVAFCSMKFDLKNAQAKSESNFNFNATSVYLKETSENNVLYAKEENKRLPIASMTKIMLLNLCFEAIDEKTLDPNEEIVVSKNASSMGGSQVFLEENGRYKARDLIKSIVVASANDASVAIAERLFGSEENCVEKMNEKREVWGLNDTLFSNCTGLPKPTQYSSARDVALMLEKLVSHKDYFEYSKVWTDEIEHSEGRKTGLTNTNKLIRFYEGCDGGKTGYTSEAGFCLAATAKRGALRLVAVVINSPDSKTRFNEVSTLFNYGFDNFTSRMVVESGKNLEIDVNVKKGDKDKIKVYPEKDLYIFSEKNKKHNVELDFTPNEKIVAPVRKGDVVGELIVFKDGIERGKTNVLAAEDSEKKTYFDYIRDIGANW